MDAPLLVLDTNVLVAALRSRTGASFQLIEQLPLATYRIAVSVPLMMEYESVLTRPKMVAVSAQQVDDLLDYVCSIAQLQQIHFLWRPTLPDPKDDMVLELAINADANAIITHNVRDFQAAAQLGVVVQTPREYLLHKKRSAR